jgi:uncharacterized protein (DUF1330 family)
MPAYAIVDIIAVTDPPLMEEYRKVVAATVTKHGGKFLVRGGAHEVMEGDWKPTRLVVLEFPSMEQAKRWYNSEEYREPLAKRLKASRGTFVFVDGVQS